MECCPVSGQTVLEERLNTLTHCLGFILSIVGWLVFLFYIPENIDWLHFSAYHIYGASLVFLYAASTFYHGTRKLDRKNVFKVLDHVCIYLLIVGTLTPFALGPLRNMWGMELLAIELGIALCGVLLKIIAIDRFKMLSLIGYLGMGWLGACSFPAMYEVLPGHIVLFVALGGVFYTCGTLFYVWDSMPYNHAVWHLFVLGGSGCHYYAILDMMRQGITA